MKFVKIYQAIWNEDENDDDDDNKNDEDDVLYALAQHA